MYNKTNRNLARKGKHRRIRNKLAGTTQVPRLCVYKSLNHIYAQIIDDEQGVTLACASTLEPDLRTLPSRTNTEAARQVGERIAEKAREKGISSVIFDRNGYKYHGRVAALADAAREKGLEF
jgi:large subunit ribosomal protein L18